MRDGRHGRNGMSHLGLPVQLGRLANEQAFGRVAEALLVDALRPQIERSRIAPPPNMFVCVRSASGTWTDVIASERSVALDVRKVFAWEWRVFVRVQRVFAAVQGVLSRVLTVFARLRDASPLQRNGFAAQGSAS